MDLNSWYGFRVSLSLSLSLSLSKKPKAQSQVFIIFSLSPFRHVLCVYVIPHVNSSVHFILNLFFRIFFFNLNVVSPISYYYYYFLSMRLSIVFFFFILTTTTTTKKKKNTKTKCFLSFFTFFFKNLMDIFFFWLEYDEFFI